MIIRVLGRTDLRIPPIIFGSMPRQNQSDESRVQILRTAIDCGLTTIDTAPLYGFGGVERQIAKALNGRRPDAVQIFTKVGLRWDGGEYGDVMFEFTDAEGRRGVVRKNSRPESVRWEVEQSLARLRVETLDLVQIHQPDVQTPIAETMGALLDLRAQGKVRHIGVSNFSPDQVRAAQEALSDVPLASVQPDYSLANREIEAALLPLCIEQRIGVLAYSPLAGGALAVRKNSALPRRIRFAVERFLLPIADRHGVSPAAVALAWVCTQRGISAAIAGASTSAQVVEIIAALELQLSPVEVESLSAGFAPRRSDGLTRRARGFVGRRLRRLGSVLKVLK